MPAARRPAATGAAGSGATDDGFAECYAASFKALVTQLYVYTGDLALAHDLVQEAFCRALPRWRKLSAYDDPVAWVRRVAMNLAKNRWRRTKVALGHLRRQRLEHVEGPGPDRVAAVAALATLPDNQRRAMVLHYLADQPVADIAAQEGVPVGTVKSWLHRGRTALAGLLGEEAGDA
jgi:RNA polymerase sigma-70 factor (ECF subfamily)